MSDSESEKEIPQEFVNIVKKYLEVDNALKEYKERTKKLNSEKKECEEYILEYLKSTKENEINVADGKLKRNISKTQAPLKKELIQQKLTELFNDSNKANTITEEIIKSRPIVEREKLKRTKIRNK